MMSKCHSPITLNMNELPVKRVELNALPMGRIVEAILPELSKNFVNVSVEVVQCPDLSQLPFKLASEGLSGDAKVFDIGNKSCIIPEIQREKVYNLKHLKEITKSDPLFIIGACAGPYPFLGVDSELVGNVKMTGDQVDNCSHIITATEYSGECTHSLLPNNETRFSMMGNFFTSNGLRGKVLKIVCEVRKGPLSFTVCIREALAKHFGNDIVAMGGVVLNENSKVKVHVIKPDLKKAPLESEKDLENWVHLIDISPPSVSVGSIVSHDPGLSLRPTHFHTFTDGDDGGHYYNDTEPNTIKYTGYFNVAQQLIKVDYSSKDVPN